MPNGTYTKLLTLEVSLKSVALFLLKKLQKDFKFIKHVKTLNIKGDWDEL